uniref:Uncharacterized protein n=1 Tax=Amphimedon queenslandica TaxID=400682 RepID=A0A1X7TW07_AMPQE
EAPVPGPSRCHTVGITLLSSLFLASFQNSYLHQKSKHKKHRRRASEEETDHHKTHSTKRSTLTHYSTKCFLNGGD